MLRFGEEAAISSSMVNINLARLITGSGSTFTDMITDTFSTDLFRRTGGKAPNLILPKTPTETTHLEQLV